MGRYRALWKTLKWYERVTLRLAALILAAAAVAWFFGSETLEWAVHVSEPAFIAIGALSVILVWAQVRSASVLEREQNIWKRVLCMHEHFNDVPRPERAESVRRYLLEIGVTNPPSAYRPLTSQQSDVIVSDTGNEHRAPAKVLITLYLNDWESFCGAIAIGAVDEDYARDMEGTRLIDAFFGYREVINRFRAAYEGDSKSSNGSTAAEPFAHKLYIELQETALKWHLSRCAELKAQEKRLAAVNQEADAKRAEAKRQERIFPKARDRDHGDF